MAELQKTQKILHDSSGSPNINKKRKRIFWGLVYSQFEQRIIMPIIEFAENVNRQNAGRDKLTFPENQYHAPDQTTFFWQLNSFRSIAYPD